ncbi:SDR family oxidoreductase [Streptosporangium sp. NPDC002544]|uniref:SDR family oxidoreductase n=1 Tax=Streptosporangium sp. NPDC002544 TaxID=3154538 RepID=UPI00332A00D2
MGALDGRVAVITGAGRGVGREHALLFAKEGAKVVVNDLGGGTDGSGSDTTPAQEVVNEIRAAGGEAVANGDDVADAEGAERLIRTAVDTFGDLHVLVNNAGILRDRMLVNMSDEEWDSVIRVHMRGHFMPTRAAARYWREKSKSGATVDASVINTASTSGLFGNVGQTNYGAAKSGLASFTMILQWELERYGVRANAIAPAARTRLTGTIPGREDRESLTGTSSQEFDKDDPANIAPFVAYLATKDCPIKGRVFFVHGGAVHLFQPWAIVDTIDKKDRWTVAELEKQAAHFADVEFDLRRPY